MQDIWLPSNTPHSKASGRFVDHVHEYTNREGEKCSRTVVLLETKVPGSQDVSAQLVKDNSEGRKLKAEYSLAWAQYEKKKAAAPVAAPVPTAVEYGIKGTPIEDLDFIGKDRLAMLKGMGFLTVEQVRDMSDSICDRVGMGAKSFRKKAAQHLVAKAG